MPALPNVAKVVRIDWHQLQEGLPMMNRIFVDYSGTLSATDAATFATLCRTSWGGAGNIGSVTSNNTQLVRTVITDLSNPSSPQAEDDTGVTGSGTTSHPLSAAVCAVVKFRVARRYRGGHPRFYLGGQDATNLQTLDTWFAATISNIASCVAHTIGLITAGAPAAMGTVQHVNVSYYSGFHNVTYPSGRTRPVPTLRNTPAVDLVIGYAGNAIVGSQRRRNRQST